MRREGEFRYSKLTNILREQILSGYIKPGQFLLSENDLCSYYGVSRTSVRKSLEQLLKDGLIIKRVGQGSIVNPNLKIEETPSRILRIFTTSPSHFMDYGMPLIIERFQRDYPQVEIKFLNFPTNSFWSSVRSSIELGLEPDLIFVTDRLYSELESLDPFMDLEDSVKSLSSIYTRLRSLFSQDGHLKAVPVTFSPVYLAYNPNLFQTHGVPLPTGNWTKDDFLRAAQKLTLDLNGDGINDLYGLSLSSSFSRWPVFALQNGVDFTQPEQREPIVRTLTFFHDLIFRHRVATLSASDKLNSDAFFRGKSAMVLTTAIELAGRKADHPGFEPALAALPFGDSPGTMLITNAFMVPSSCNHLELALQFLQTAFSPDLQETLCREAGFWSAAESVNEAVWPKTVLDTLGISNDKLMSSSFLHELFAGPATVEELDAEMELFWMGHESAEEFADRMLQIITSK